MIHSLVFQRNFDNLYSIPREYFVPLKEFWKYNSRLLSQVKMINISNVSHYICHYVNNKVPILLHLVIYSSLYYSYYYFSIFWAKNLGMLLESYWFSDSESEMGTAVEGGSFNVPDRIYVHQLNLTWVFDSLEPFLKIIWNTIRNMHSKFIFCWNTVYLRVLFSCYYFFFQVWRHPPTSEGERDGGGGG